jgi:predicted MPP superfamily phosphohydrolase
VVGLEDNFLWHDDYFVAASVVPTGESRIVLGHAPAIAEKIDPEGVEMILSGHLHGGQIILPIYGPLARNTVCYVSRSYTAGLYQVNGMPLYSNRGLGTSLLPFRFLARPEIAVFEFAE